MAANRWQREEYVWKMEKKENYMIYYGSDKQAKRYLMSQGSGGSGGKALV